MNLKEIANARLVNQQLTDSKFQSIYELVSYMGALQAQDYAMSKWAVGCRVTDSTDMQIEKALDEGLLIRTHVLRPTWQIVLSHNARWMLQLTAPAVKTASASIFKRLELDEALLNRCNVIIRRDLEGGKHLTRGELMIALANEGIVTSDNRSSLIMMRAELDRIVCSGVRRGKQLTYALFDERIPQTPDITKEEALARLAKLYFTSRGPATVYDFSWWSGLSVTDAKKALELLKGSLQLIQLDGQNYWFSENQSLKTDEKSSFLLLPAFDEYLIAYRDRSAKLDLANTREVITVNGIFKPTVVENGKIIGSWKRTTKKDTVNIEKQLFKTSKDPNEQLFQKEVERYARFLANVPMC